jgi:hypothetical protein
MPSIPQGLSRRTHCFSRDVVRGNCAVSTGFLGFPIRISCSCASRAERVLDFGSKVASAVCAAQIGASAVGEFRPPCQGSQRFFCRRRPQCARLRFSMSSRRSRTGSRSAAKHLLTGTVEIERDLPRNFRCGRCFAGRRQMHSNTLRRPRCSSPWASASAGGLPVVHPSASTWAQPLTNPSCRNREIPTSRLHDDTPGFDDPAGTAPALQTSRRSSGRGPARSPGRFVIFTIMVLGIPCRGAFYALGYTEGGLRFVVENLPEKVGPRGTLRGRRCPPENTERRPSPCKRFTLEHETRVAAHRRHERAGSRCLPLLWQDDRGRMSCAFQYAYTGIRARVHARRPVYTPALSLPRFLTIAK